MSILQHVDARALREILQLPEHWPQPSYPLGVLFAAFPQRLYNVSAGLPPRTQCELYGRRERKYVSSFRLTLLAETALAAALLREQMQPQLPIALATEPSIGAFLGHEAGVALPWDLYVGFDTVAAERRLEAARVRDPASVRMRPQASIWLWKLAAFLISPFERTVYVDADIMVLSGTLAADMLHRSLRTYDMAMPVDVARLGSLDPRWSSRRTKLDKRKVFKAAPMKYALVKRPETAQETPHARIESGANLVVSPPMFSRGQPPFCCCLMAYKRTPKVRQFFMAGATRLLGAMHLTDPTNSTLGIRQTDQEMLWFELHTGDPTSQPSVMLLPEEYYCPSTRGTHQAVDFADALHRGQKPWWGFYTKRWYQMGSSMDRYQAGSVKDCHAVHLKLTLNMLQHHWNVSREVPWLNLHWILERLPLEMFCSERRYLNITPGCSVPPSSHLLSPRILTEGLLLQSHDLERESRSDTAHWPTCNVGRRGGQGVVVAREFVGSPV